MPSRTRGIDMERLRELWAAGKTCDEVAAALGCSRSHVSRLATEKLGFPIRRQGSRKLPGLRVEALYNEGMDPRKIARLFGVSDGAVRRLLLSRKVPIRHKSVLKCPWLGPVVRLRRKGFSIRKTAKILGITPEMVDNRSRAILGWKARGK